MTEDEAKTKWCPFARVAAQDMTLEPIGGTADAFRGTKHAVVLNRISLDGGSVGGIPATALCITSACMAWREVPARPEASYANAPPPRAAIGYCGLAGTPG